MIAKLPTVAKVNGKPLLTTAIVWHMVCIHASTGIKQCHAINFIVADIINYDVILGLAWLQKRSPDIRWDKGVWHWHTHTNAEDGQIYLVSAGAFVGTMRAERMQAYDLHLTDFSPKIVSASAGNVLIATEPERTVPDANNAYAWVFSEADSESLPTHGPHDLTIELLNGKQLP